MVIERNEERRGQAPKASSTIYPGRLRRHRADVPELPHNSKIFLGIQVIEFVLADLAALNHFIPFALQIPDRLQAIFEVDFCVMKTALVLFNILVVNALITSFRVSGK